MKLLANLLIYQDYVDVAKEHQPTPESDEDTLLLVEREQHSVSLNKLSIISHELESVFQKEKISFGDAVIICLCVSAASGKQFTFT